MVAGAWMRKPSLRHIEGKVHVVTLAGRYRAADDTVYVIPQGFVTDGGSVPRALWWWMPPFGDNAESAYVLHDYAYKHAELLHGSDDGHISRLEADNLLREAALAAGEPARRVPFIWSGVRAGGWAPWKKYRVQARIDAEAGV